MKDKIDQIMNSVWMERGLLATVASFPLYMGIAILVLPWTHHPGFQVLPFAISRSISAVVGVVFLIIGIGLMYGSLTGDLKVRNGAQDKSPDEPQEQLAEAP